MSIHRKTNDQRGDGTDIRPQPEHRASILLNTGGFVWAIHGLLELPKTYHSQNMNGYLLLHNNIRYKNQEHG